MIPQVLEPWKEGSQWQKWKPKAKNQEENDLASLPLFTSLPPVPTIGQNCAEAIWEEKLRSVGPATQIREGQSREWI